MYSGAKKKGLNLNKAQSPMKEIGFDFQFRSSAELAKQFQTKKEKLAHDKEYRAVKEQAPVTHKWKHPMPTISNAREGKSRQGLIQHEESFQEQGNGKLPMRKSTIQLSSKEDLNTSHMIGRRQGEGEIFKKVKRKSVLSATSLDHFLGKKGIYVGGEKQPDTQPVYEHNIELDDFAAQEEVGEDECVRDEAMNVESATRGELDKKKVRGQTKCKMIHARNIEERQEVTFDKGQAVGPTGKRVSELNNFIGTIARNPRFITLLFTSWHAVTDDIKQRMWEYVNTKFIIPAEGKKWVMDCLRDAWRRHKRNIKKNHFDEYHTIEDMLKNRPTEIPEVQFLQLIEYWRDLDIQAMCKLNSENRNKQKWRHRMGPINFARVRVALHASKENNEEPSKSEMFIATRTKQGKQVHEDAQIAISELQNCQNSGETSDETFREVFGKEQPGRIRCYGRSVTTSSLKKDEEINKLQQKHNNEVSTLKAEMQE